MWHHKRPLFHIPSCLRKQVIKGLRLHQNVENSSWWVWTLWVEKAPSLEQLGCFWKDLMPPKKWNPAKWGEGAPFSLHAHTILVWLPVERKTKRISKATTGLWGRASRSRTLAETRTKKIFTKLEQNKQLLQLCFYVFCSWRASTRRGEKRKCCHWLEGSQRERVRERQRGRERERE